MTHLFALPVAIAVFACALLFDVAAQPGASQLLMLAIAATAVVTAILFAPQRDSANPAWFKTTLSDGTLITTIFVVAVFASRADEILFLALLRVAGICFLMSLFCLSILSTVGGNVERNRQFLLLIFIALFAAPVWLAPVAEAFGNTAWLANTIVAISPLSAFATALDIDVLRTAWLYEHSVLGSLRYSYPSLTSYALALGALTILTFIPKLLVQKRRTKQ